MTNSNVLIETDIFVFCWNPFFEFPEITLEDESFTTHLLKDTSEAKCLFETEKHFYLDFELLENVKVFSLQIHL